MKSVTLTRDLYMQGPTNRKGYVKNATWTLWLLSVPLARLVPKSWPSKLVSMGVARCTHRCSGIVGDKQRHTRRKTQEKATRTKNKYCYE